jgi:hypothetical protein
MASRGISVLTATFIILIGALATIAGAPHNAHLPDLQQLLWDDFESGNACAWSAIVGYADGDETEATAVPLPDTTDCDEDHQAFAGLLNGADDIDFFVIRLTDDATCTLDPEVTISGQPDVGVCVYVQCLGGTTDLAPCSGSSTPDTSPQGRPGCCTTESSLPFSYTCTGSSVDDADFWIRVGTSAPGCATYDGDIRG